ncbi:hypothetical protein SLEP1_g25660 [Rubroshorea leprosula]|uniref:RNase H type-1 domain-containing protein n=1 Tax=Rubroshorea leprosula TaxID=152421 RepID=A0AAV5JQZ0_9ROSI|nr:hypothetical protein SLEP1_g25660 [Rubroshorea leprosula]
MGKHVVFCWDKPLPNSVKLNIDDAALGIPKPAVAGGIFRDPNGNWIMGYARHIGIINSLSVEH